METTTLYVSGMACGGCAHAVRQALLALDGVVEAKVSHVEATAEVRYDPSRVGIPQLKAAIEQAGYSVT
ncbi:MAG: cation transporter [Methylophilaceae bacterium]|nr:cation transporter [Methylophilaceae bacterium]